jgi:hypothetical protein
MRIKIHPNAATNYVRRCYRNAHPSCGMLHRPEFERMLEQVGGQWVDVETDHLFSDQFNTAPIPGVSELGLRVMHADVVEIEGDIREGIAKCQWCYGYDRTGAGVCDQCGKAEYLGPLVPLKIYTKEAAEHAYRERGYDMHGKPIPA